MSDAQLPFLLAGMLIFAFGLLVLALFLGRRWVGWAQLEQLFPDKPDDAIVAHYSVQSLYVCKPGKPMPGPYIQGFVSLTACETGLRITIAPIFRPFFKKILIPWNEISTVTVTLKILRLKGLGLRVGPGEPFTLTIIARVGRKIADVTNGKLEIPPNLQK